MQPEKNQDLPLPKTAIIFDFPIDKDLQIRQTYQSKLFGIRSIMPIDDVILELAAYKTAEALQMPYSEVLRTVDNV